MELNEIETPKYLLCDVDIRNGKRIESEDIYNKQGYLITSFENEGKFIND